MVPFDINPSLQHILPNVVILMHTRQMNLVVNGVEILDNIKLISPCIELSFRFLLIGKLQYKETRLAIINKPLVANAAISLRSD